MYFATPILLNISSARGIGYASKADLAFNLRKSTQNRGDPSFFGTRTMGAAHGLTEGQITSAFSISFLTASLLGKGIR